MGASDGNRSSLKEFLSSIATIKGDLSNITAPPFVLASKSTVEYPSSWASHHSLFLAPASESSPARRALAVLRWFLASLKNQQYGGREGDEGIKKPLNAFLGELFVASFGSEEGDDGQTQLVAEQVSHHPPVTACCLWNEKVGVRAEGYAGQEITFSGSVNVKQYGHAILHIDRYDEDYLIPLPDVKVKGILTGTTYPELHGKYHIVSSTGYVSEIDFSGKGFLSGKKNSVDVTMYKDKSPVYTVSGQWNGEFVISEGDHEVETINVDQLRSTPMTLEPLDQQDDWESRKAWRGVIAALDQGDMQRTVDEKSKVEEAQRELRKLEESKGVKWEPLFFSATKSHPVFETLAKEVGGDLQASKTAGVWRFNDEKWKNGVAKPYHQGLTPSGGQL